jgi:hypothetical protein
LADRCSGIGGTPAFVPSTTERLEPFLGDFLVAVATLGNGLELLVDVFVPEPTSEIVRVNLWFRVDQDGPRWALLLGIDESTRWRMRGFYTGEGARPSVNPIDRSLSIELPPSPADPDPAACCAARWGLVQLRSPTSLLQSFTFERSMFCEALSDLVQNAESSVRVRGPLVVSESDLDRLAPHQMIFEADLGAAFFPASAHEAIERVADRIDVSLGLGRDVLQPWFDAHCADE